MSRRREEGQGWAKGSRLRQGKYEGRKRKSRGGIERMTEAGNKEGEE